MYMAQHGIYFLIFHISIGQCAPPYTLLIINMYIRKKKLISRISLYDFKSIANTIGIVYFIDFYTRCKLHKIVAPNFFYRKSTNYVTNGIRQVRQDTDILDWRIDLMVICMFRSGKMGQLNSTLPNLTGRDDTNLKRKTNIYKSKE